MDSGILVGLEVTRNGTTWHVHVAFEDAVWVSGSVAEDCLALDV
jgi:hypothetical protein